MKSSDIGFLMQNEDNLIGEAELLQNKIFMHCYLLATHGLDFGTLNIQALVKEFASQSGQYSEQQMHNIVGGCFLLHHYLPRVKRLALEQHLVNYEKLRTLWKSLITVALDTPQALWDELDAVIVDTLTASKENQTLPTNRRLAAKIRDELIRLGVYEEFEEEPTPEENMAKLEAMLGVEMLTSPHPGVSVLNVTMPSDNAYEIKQRLEAVAASNHLREDEVLTNYVCGTDKDRDTTCSVRLFGFADTADATDLTPVSLHGVGRLTTAQQQRIQKRHIQYDSILAVAEIIRGVHKATPEQRLLVMLRDGTCRFPGCSVDAIYCEIDHIINFEVGGWTTLSNLQCLCKHHHNFKTDRHAQATSDTLGNITWEFATGMQVTTVPQGILAGKVQGMLAGIATKHDHPTKTDEDYLEPPIRNDFGRWGTTLINYRNRQRKRYLERNHLRANIPHNLPLEEDPPPASFEPPPDDAWPGPPEDYLPPGATTATRQQRPTPPRRTQAQAAETA